MIKTRVLGLLENHELLSFHVDHSLMAEFELKWFVFQALCTFVWTLFPLLFNHICLQIGQFLKTLFCTLDHDISRLLKRNVVLALNMFNIVFFMRILKFGDVGLFPIFLCGDHSVSLQELLFEIFALQLLEIEVSF